MNKNLRGLLALVAAGAMAFSLSACGNSGNGNNASTQSAPAASSAETTTAAAADLGVGFEDIPIDTEQESFTLNIVVV